LSVAQGKAIGPITPWRWLQQAAGLLRAQPRALIGATSLLLATTLAPTVVEGLLGAVAPGLSQLLALAVSALVVPPVVAGYYRLVHALAQGQALPPAAIFAVFSDGPAVRRMIIANLIFVSGALLIVMLLVWGFGGEPLLQFVSAVMKVQPGAKVLPALPPGVLPLVLSLLVFGLGLVTVQGLAFCELALGPRPPLAAIGAALGLTLRHFGLLLLFYVPIAVFAFLAFLLDALVAALLGMLFPAAAAVLVLAFALLLALVMYALLFGFYYYAWRELLGEVAAPPAPGPTHEIAV
jgi:hypothetical protein